MPLMSFEGARKDGPEKSDGRRLRAPWKIELSVRSESELTMRFNAELSLCCSL